MTRTIINRGIMNIDFELMFPVTSFLMDRYIQSHINNAQENPKIETR